MKYNKIISALAGLLLIGTYSCTDEWNDHYAETVPGSGGSLWQAICNEPSLSNFKSVLEATGYQSLLAGSQVFTVFAPTNDNFSQADAEALIEQYNAEKANHVKDEKNSVIREFVQNHISLYNYSVSESMKDTTVAMMNGKNIPFTSTSFAGHEYLKANNLTGNGVLFTVGDVAKYTKSVYETLIADNDFSGIAKYLSEYTLDVFQPSKSVPGEIIDGKTHYLDSVTVTHNSILSNHLGALIDNEDSTYWMVAPTDDVWNTLVSNYEKNYVYDAKISEAERDSFQYHFPRLAVLQGAIFSKTSNRKVFANETSEATDSLVSTNAAPYTSRRTVYGDYALKYYQYSDPFGAEGILAGATPIESSNGKVFKTSKWNIKPTETILKTIIMEAENSRTLDSLNTKTDARPKGDTAPAKYVNVSPANPFYNEVSGHSYLEISPTGAANFTGALLDIRNVLSNVPYDVYIVTVPAEAGDTLATAEQRLPTIIRVSLQCHNEKGQAYYMNKADSKLQYPVYTKPDDETSKVTTNNTKSDVYNQLTTVAGEVNELFVGTYTFPTCTYGVNDAQVKMLIQSYVTSTANNKTANRILRIDRIVLKPHVE